MVCIPVYIKRSWASSFIQPGEEQVRNHPEKCKILTVGKLENIQRAYPYRLMKVQLEHVFEEKDLGIIIDTDLTFDVHESEKINKANNMLGLIRRYFCCLNTDILLPLYKAFVRHLLEYVAQVWSGCLKRSQIRAIEKIQMRATEMIEGMSYIDYSEQLNILRLPTLSYQRARGGMETIPCIWSQRYLTKLPANKE